MFALSKKLTFFVCLSFLSVSIAFAKEKTKRLQLLLYPNTEVFSDFYYTINGIEASIEDTVFPGSLVATNALIFPDHTVNKNQVDYSVNRFGQPIDPAEAIGIAYMQESALIASDANPDEDTPLADAQWTLSFFESCDDLNAIIGEGLAVVNNVEPEIGQALTKYHFNAIAAFGCNEDVQDSHFSAKVYNNGNENGVLLVRIKFRETVEYKEPEIQVII